MVEIFYKNSVAFKLCITLIDISSNDNYIHAYLPYILQCALVLTGYGAPAGGQTTKGKVLKCKAEVQDSQKYSLNYPCTAKHLLNF